jgi:hypothetical protein
MNKRNRNGWCSERPERWTNLPEGQAIAGHPVGILCIPGVSALIPGNVQNAGTFDFPVLYKVLENVRFEQIASGDRAVEAAIVAGAEELVANGVRAVVGACGSLGHYQSAVANAVAVPVFMSILTQVPLILRSLGSRQKLAIVFASKDTFTPLIQSECGIDDPERIVSVGLMDCPSFMGMTESEKHFDGNALFQEMVTRIEGVIDDSVGALLLQCSDLPPFAAELQSYFGRPVFDMTGLIAWLQAAVVRKPFEGSL